MNWKKSLFTIAAIQVGTGVTIIGVLSFIPLFLVEMVEQRACGSIGYIRNSGEKKCLNEMNEDIFLVGDFFNGTVTVFGG